MILGRIGLIPLDERPVNTRYPQMIAEVAGVTVVLPPHELLSDLKRPAAAEALASWLRQQVNSFDALVFSVEMLGYGGLIASRTVDDTAAQVINRFEVLREIRETHPNLTIYGFNVITRIPDANDSIEEPDYWSDYGRRLHRYSQLLDRVKQGHEVAGEITALEAEVPLAVRSDWLRRRLRNHTVNLAVLELVASGVIDTLVLSSDDTSEYGIGTREKRWLAEWVERLGLDHDDRVLMYPGADEVGCALVARLLTRAAPPKFAVRYAIPEDAGRTAPYEDGPVRVTVERQIHAVGGVMVEDVDSADFIVAVNPPSRIGREFDPEPEHVASEQAHRTPPLQNFAANIGAWLDEGKRVIVADVGYPNGADPVLIQLLFDQVDVRKLAAYGAWNTAGNTIGTALAQGIAASLAPDAAHHDLNERFLTHRFVEDWAYQHLGRDEVRSWLEETVGRRDVPEGASDTRVAEVSARIEAGLQERLSSIPHLGARWRISPNSTNLPWRRTFEVDFDLEGI